LPDDSLPDDAPTASDGFLAARLAHLFRTVVSPEDGRPYSVAAVARALNEASGESTISAGYVWQLKSGHRDNPTYKQLIALSRFFGVSPAYFFEDAELARGDIPADAALAMQYQGIREIALRAAGLSERSLKVIADMVYNARQLEEASPRRPRRTSRQADNT
jgi:transcriptional regulator with XRE-family HTH domain